MLNKKSINIINGELHNLLNYVSDKYNRQVELTAEEIRYIHLKASALEMALELAYINDQLHKISFYNLNYWNMLFDMLKKTSFDKHIYNLLKLGYENLLEHNGLKKDDIKELISRLW